MASQSWITCAFVSICPRSDTTKPVPVLSRENLVLVRAADSPPTDDDAGEEDCGPALPGEALNPYLLRSCSSLLLLSERIAFTVATPLDRRPYGGMLIMLDRPFVMLPMAALRRFLSCVDAVIKTVDQPVSRWSDRT